MKRAVSFLNSILGGMCIGIGGVVFLSCDSKVAGAIFFCLGLFTICTFGFNLYTGKVGYVFDNPLSYTWFVLSVFCNILMFIAVDGYKNNPHELGKYLGIFLGVIVFILCGFEHCVANMFYFSVANVWGGKALLYMLVMSVGNACGGVIIPLVRKLKAKAEAV